MTTFKNQLINMGACTSSASIEEITMPEYSFSVFPNPVFSSGFHLELNTVPVRDVSITIVNVLGEEIYSHTVNNIAGKLEETINLKDAPAGVYFLQVHFRDRVTSKKIVLLK